MLTLSYWCVQLFSSSQENDEHLKEWSTIFTGQEEAETDPLWQEADVKFKNFLI